MEQLTLEQAANNYAPNSGGFTASRAHQRQTDFKAGAEWQKEQYKEVINELNVNHELLLSLYKAIDFRPDRLDLKSIQQDLRDRMAKQLTLINNTTK